MVESVNEVGIPDELRLGRPSATEFGSDRHKTEKQNKILQVRTESEQLDSAAICYFTLAENCFIAPATFFLI